MEVCDGANSARSENLQSESKTPRFAYRFPCISLCTPIAMLSQHESYLFALRKHRDCNAKRLLSDCKQKPPIPPALRRVVSKAPAHGGQDSLTALSPEGPSTTPAGNGMGRRTAQEHWRAGSPPSLCRTVLRQQQTIMHYELRIKDLLFP